jgi:hypothetical protein
MLRRFPGATTAWRVVSRAVHTAQDLNTTDMSEVHHANHAIERRRAMNAFVEMASVQ